ncbi:hypothetical protein LUZ60_000494 [Juncus effusus]|nr:hypothetical protein LUZ60_000494 [Juncus effusus]
MEELQERDVIWPDRENNHKPSVNGAQSASEEIRVSAPINIPNSRETTHADFDLDSEEGHQDDNNDGGRKIVPPHIIIARRFADQMFSVCFGNGRTLRGRDLINFRNSIFRMTGFIE